MLCTVQMRDVPMHDRVTVMDMCMDVQICYPTLQYSLIVKLFCIITSQIYSV